MEIGFLSKKDGHYLSLGYIRVKTGTGDFSFSSSLPSGISARR
jgi:hypothetical protein